MPLCSWTCHPHGCSGMQIIRLLGILNNFVLMDWLIKSRSVVRKIIVFKEMFGCIINKYVYAVM